MKDGYAAEFDCPGKLLYNPRSIFAGMAKDAGIAS